MKVDRIVVGSMQENCYILSCEITKEAIVVDPGFEAKRIIKFIEENELKPQSIVLTHGHYDHIGGVEEIKNAFNVDIIIHQEDVELIEDPDKNFSSRTNKIIKFSADRIVEEMNTIKFGNEEVVVIHTPGHTHGGICLLSGKILIAGDTLFKQSIGRTDLSGCSEKFLVKSIKKNLMVLEDDVKVFPGHGPSSTIGFERKNNPYLTR